MKNLLIKGKLYFIGAIVGAVAGFLYWKYIGCLTGTCSITSSPINSTLFFAFFGAILFGSFKKQTKQIEVDKQ